MSIKRNIKNKLDKLALSINKLDDNFDKKYIRFNNKNLVLIPKGDKYILAVISSSQTKRWLAANIEVKNNSNEYGKVAYSLDDVPFALETQVSHGKHSENITYLFEGKEVAPLFDHSPKSKVLFWTIEKLDCLAKFDENEKLTGIQLVLLQDEIDAEKEKLTNKSKEEKIASENEEELTF